MLKLYKELCALRNGGDVARTGQGSARIVRGVHRPHTHGRHRAERLEFFTCPALALLATRFVRIPMERSFLTFVTFWQTRRDQKPSCTRDSARP